MERFDLPKKASVLIVLLAALAACDSDLPMGPGSHTEPEVIETTDFHGSLEINLSEFTKTDTGIYHKSITDGAGNLSVGAGDTVTVYYGAWLSNGTPLDPGEIIFIRSAVGAPAKTLPNGGGVIPGFDQGIDGMKLGGVRQLIVPPDLAYGNNWVGAIIPPGSIMTFKAHLLRINDQVFSGE